MTIVVDASVALKWVLNEPGSGAADALLGEDLIAPALWLLEAANVLWKRTRRGELTSDEAKENLAELHNAPVATHPIERDLPRALELANLLDHPVYDCLYLAAALREEAHVVTADARFVAAAARSVGLGGSVRLLGT